MYYIRFDLNTIFYLTYWNNNVKAMIESNDSNFNGNSTLSYDRGSPKFNDIHICKNVANHDVNIFFRYLNKI